MEEIIRTYQRLGGGPRAFVPADVVHYAPVISPQESQQGEIIRYFTRPVHQNSPSEIVEIDKNTFENLANNPFYLTTSIRWIIRGRVADIPGLTNANTPTRLYTGVRTANRLSVEAADEFLPGIKTIITDYIKFWQGE